MKNDQLKASTIVPSLHKPDTSADFDPLYELQRDISNRNKSIRGEPQYPSSPVPVNSKHGILQSSPVEVVAKPIENVSAPTVLDEKFLDKQGFAYTQPHKARISRVEEPTKRSQPSTVQQHKGGAVDWSSPDSYSEDNLRNSVEMFLSNPMNRITRHDTRHSAKNVALSAAGSVAGLGQVALEQTIDILSVMKLPYLHLSLADAHEIKDKFNRVMHDLYTNAPRLWEAYKDNYLAQIAESNRYAQNGDSFMAGYTSTKARASVLSDVASLVIVSKAAAKAGPMLHKFSTKTYNVATMGKHKGKATNKILDALDRKVSHSSLSSPGKSTFTPGYDNRRVVVNSPEHINTGARSYNLSRHGDNTELWATPIYEDIRSWNCAENIATISKNTGIPEQMIASVRQHLFFDEHLMPSVNSKTGQMTILKERFTPDFEIAELWDLASSQPIYGTDLIKFERLIAHEYVERGLMKIGYPYRSFDSGAIKINSMNEYFLGFSRYYYGAHDMAPLSSPLVSPWKHYETIGNFEPLPKTKESIKTKILHLG